MAQSAKLARRVATSAEYPRKIRESAVIAPVAPRLAAFTMPISRSTGQAVPARRQSAHARTPLASARICSRKLDPSIDIVPVTISNNRSPGRAFELPWAAGS